MLDVLYSAGNRSHVWKVKQENDLFARILLVAHRLRGKVGEPGSEPRQFGGSSRCTGASESRNDSNLLPE